MAVWLVAIVHYSFATVKKCGQGSVQHSVEDCLQAGEFVGKFVRREAGWLAGRFLQVNRVSKERHGKAVLFFAVGIGQLKAVHFFVDLLHDPADDGFVIRLYFQRIWPSGYRHGQL